MTPREALARYERETNSRDFSRIAPLIADDAVYWFNDGSFRGREEIRAAFERTWARIENEEYRIVDVEWIVEDADTAVSIYHFHWRGTVRGERTQGGGRGTGASSKGSPASGR